MAIVVNDCNCENEGDFIVSAEELLTLQKLARLIRCSSGVVCVILDDNRA